jgi:hypothetical protein
MTDVKQEGKSTVPSKVKPAIPPRPTATVPPKAQPMVSATVVRVAPPVPLKTSAMTEEQKKVNNAFDEWEEKLHMYAQEMKGFHQFLTSDILQKNVPLTASQKEQLNEMAKFAEGISQACSAMSLPKEGANWTPSQKLQYIQKQLRSPVGQKLFENIGQYTTRYPRFALMMGDIEKAKFSSDQAALTKFAAPVITKYIEKTMQIDINKTMSDREKAKAKLQLTQEYRKELNAQLALWAPQNPNNLALLKHHCGFDPNMGLTDEAIKPVQYGPRFELLVGEMFKASHNKASDGNPAIKDNALAEMAKEVKKDIGASLSRLNNSLQEEEDPWKAIYPDTTLSNLVIGYGIHSKDIQPGTQAELKKLCESVPKAKVLKDSFKKLFGLEISDQEAVRLASSLVTNRSTVIFDQMSQDQSLLDRLPSVKELQQEANAKAKISKTKIHSADLKKGLEKVTSEIPKRVMQRKEAVFNQWVKQLQTSDPELAKTMTANKNLVLKSLDSLPPTGLGQKSLNVTAAMGISNLRQSLKLSEAKEGTLVGLYSQLMQEKQVLLAQALPFSKTLQDMMAQKGEMNIETVRTLKQEIDEQKPDRHGLRKLLEKHRVIDVALKGSPASVEVDSKLNSILAEMKVYKKQEKRASIERPGLVGVRPRSASDIGVGKMSLPTRPRVVSSDVGVGTGSLPVAKKGLFGRTMDVAKTVVKNTAAALGLTTPTFPPSTTKTVEGKLFHGDTRKIQAAAAQQTTQLASQTAAEDEKFRQQLTAKTPVSQEATLGIGFGRKKTMDEFLNVREELDKFSKAEPQKGSGKMFDEASLVTRGSMGNYQSVSIKTTAGATLTFDFKKNTMKIDKLDLESVKAGLALAKVMGITVVDTLDLPANQALIVRTAAHSENMQTGRIPSATMTAVPQQRASNVRGGKG